ESLDCALLLAGYSVDRCRPEQIPALENPEVRRLFPRSEAQGPRVERSMRAQDVWHPGAPGSPARRERRVREQRVHVQHVVGMGMLREPSSKRPGECPGFRVLPRKVEVADAAIHHWPVEWHTRLAPTVGRGRGDVEIDAECRE